MLQFAMHKFKPAQAIIRRGDRQTGRILFRQYCVVRPHTGEYFHLHEDDIRSYARRLGDAVGIRENQHWQEFEFHSDRYFLQPSYVVHWQHITDVTSELEENLTTI